MGRLNSTPEPAAMSRFGCARYRAREIAGSITRRKKVAPRVITLALLRAGVFILTADGWPLTAVNELAVAGLWLVVSKMRK